MLDGGLDPMYRAALATSHQPYTLIEVLDGQQNVLAEIGDVDPPSDDPDMVFLGGSVTATLTSRVSRHCEISFPETLYPFLETDLLAPYGNMIRVTKGIEFAEGSRSAWPIFIGRIQDASLDGDGTCSISASDFAADVLENKFVAPENSQASSTVTQEIVRLISDGFDQATFGLVEQFAVLARTRTWQLDRGQGLDELATSVGAYWYPLADGKFTLRSYPWAVSSPVVVTYSDADPLGTVEKATANRSRSAVFNSLTVTGERLNGDPPVYALAQDTNPANVTYINGNFGRRHQLLRLQTPGSFEAAQAAARENLQRLISPVDTWSWTMTPDTALELGDTVGLDVYGKTGIVQVVASMRIPLGLGRMQVAARSRVIGILEGVD